MTETQPKPKWGGVAHAGIVTFMGAPLLAEVSEKELRARNIKAAIFGIPFDGASYMRPGASLGPRAIRDTSAFFPYHVDYDVDLLEKLNPHDCGDSFIAVGDAKATVENGASVASEILKAGAIPVILGGEHTITLAGTMAIDRTLQGRYGFIHFDAHTDSANEIDGNKWNNACQVSRTSELEAFPCENMVLIGVRGMLNSREDWQFLKENGITCFSMRQVLDIGLESAVDQALEIATRGTDGFYVTIDMDVLEAAHVPGAYPTPNGITVRELWSVLPKLGLNDKLTAFDVAEVNPLYDAGEITASTAAAIVAELLAARASIMR